MEKGKRTKNDVHIIYERMTVLWTLLRSNERERKVGLIGNLCQQEDYQNPMMVSKNGAASKLDQHEIKVQLIRCHSIMSAFMTKETR